MHVFVMCVHMCMSMCVECGICILSDAEAMEYAHGQARSTGRLNYLSVLAPQL